MVRSFAANQKNEREEIGASFPDLRSGSTGLEGLNVLGTQPQILSTLKPMEHPVSTHHISVLEMLLDGQAERNSILTSMLAWHNHHF